MRFRNNRIGFAFWVDSSLHQKNKSAVSPSTQCSSTLINASSKSFIAPQSSTTQAIVNYHRQASESLDSLSSTESSSNSRSLFLRGRTCDLSSTLAARTSTRTVLAMSATFPTTHAMTGKESTMSRSPAEKYNVHCVIDRSISRSSISAFRRRDLSGIIKP